MSEYAKTSRLAARTILMNAGCPDMQLTDPRLDELSGILDAAYKNFVRLFELEHQIKRTPEDSGFVTDREKFDAD